MYWWAILTASQKEAFVDYHLRFTKGFETWFPHQSPSWEPAENSKVLTELRKRAFFPRYTFVHAQRDDLPDVISVENVSRIVGPRWQEPVPVPDEAMAILFKELGRSGKVYSHWDEKPSFEGQIGQRFKVAEGFPYFGFLAAISRLDNEKLFAILEEKMFGAEGREVEMPFAAVGELLPVTATATKSA